MLKRIFPMRDAEREGAPRPRILERISRRGRRGLQTNFADLIGPGRVFSKEQPPAGGE